jgi:hypothetical protein
MPEEYIHQFERTDFTQYGDLFALQRGPNQSDDFKTNSIGLMGLKLYTMQVTYTLAQLSAGQTMVAAPGSGQIVWPIDAWMRYDQGVGAALDYVVAIQGCDDIYHQVVRLDGGSGGFTLTNNYAGLITPNQPTTISGTGSFGAANGTFTVWLAYTTIPV